MDIDHGLGHTFIGWRAKEVIPVTYRWLTIEVCGVCLLSGSPVRCMVRPCVSGWMMMVVMNRDLETARILLGRQGCGRR